MRVLPLLLFLALRLTAAADFVPPDEAKILFRRDLLPIDTDTMRVLSAQLTELARREHQDKAAELRATAQILAIASRLDPVNRRARDISQRLTEGRDFNPAEPPALRRAKAETWHIIDWLLHDDAGAAGQLLGNQLVDALRIIDPKHPAATRHQPNGEAARWEGVVAPLENFGEKKPPTPDGGNTATAPTSSQDPVPPEPPVDPPPILLNSVHIRTPMIVVGPSNTKPARIVPVSLIIKENELAARFEFKFQPGIESGDSGESSLLRRVITGTRTPLLALWKALPPRNTAEFSTDTERYLSRNGTALTGPAALLIHAALVGKTLRDDVVFIGEAQADGTLVAPARAWELLIAVRQGPGGRLLVPPDLKGHLRNLLVLGEPEFFVKYEVLVVSSLDSALQLASSGSDPEGLVEAAPQFEELRRIATSKPVGELAVNTHVQARLNTICEAAPFHLSARMLLLQGSGRRPTRLDLATFRQELIRDLEPMNRVIWADTAKLTSVTLEQSFNECSKRLDSIETLVRVEDRPLREEAVGMANTLRTLARLRKQGLTTAAFTELHIQLKANYSKFLKDLGAAAPVPPPVGGP